MRRVTVIEPPSVWRLRPFHQIAELRHFSDLIWTLSIHRIKVRYKQSRLGIAWAILQPLAMMLVFTLMFSLLGTAPSHGLPYPLFAFAALLPWSAFSSGLSTASASLTGHASLLTKVYFPREILPLTYVVAALADLAVASTALAGLMWWYGVGVSASMVWAPVALLILAAFVLGLGLLLSAVQVRYRDIALAMPVILQVWLFATPVLYPLEFARRALDPPLYQLYILNPMAGVVETFRRAVVLHQPPDVQALGTAAIVTLLLLPIAYAYFKYTELTMADVV